MMVALRDATGPALAPYSKEPRRLYLAQCISCRQTVGLQLPKYGAPKGQALEIYCRRCDVYTPAAYFSTVGSPDEHREVCEKFIRFVQLDPALTPVIR